MSEPATHSSGSSSNEMAGADDDERADSLSEWMKVMLGEIERKESEQQEAREELGRRGGYLGAAAGKDGASNDPHG